MKLSPLLAGLLACGLSSCESGPRSGVPPETSTMPRPRNSTSAPGPTEPGKATLADRLKSILPDGWSVAQTASNVVPDGWISDSATGTLLEGRRGADTFRVWFLPRDWIGVRKPDPARRRPNYWDGILAGDEHTTITLSTESTVPDLVRKLGMSTPSLVNGGWGEAERVFRGHFSAAEAEAERLIAARCPDRASRDEAAYSLVVLGIPAASVFRRAALEGTGDAREMSISALSHFPGDATVATVAAVLRDPATPDRARGYAGQVAGDLAAKELGPALLDALGLARDTDTRDRVILGIAGVRYAPAGAAVEKAMEDTDSPHAKARFAWALAVLRHRPAAPAIRRLAEGPFPTGTFKLTKDAEEDIRARARLALLVLTGDWGAPVDGLRFHLEAPAEKVAGAPIQVVIHVENVSDEAQSYFGAMEGKIVIDDRPHDRRMGPADGPDTLRPNAVWQSTEDLSAWIKAPGTYRVRYEKGAARSNTVTVVVNKAD